MTRTDDRAFEILVREHHRRLLAYALAMVESRATAEDVVQDAFVTAYRKLRTFDAWRILAAPDHPTPISKKTHTDTPVPFCMAGEGVPNVAGQDRFTEQAAEKSDLYIERGCELMEFFLRR